MVVKIQNKFGFSVRRLVTETRKTGAIWLRLAGSLLGAKIWEVGDSLRVRERRENKPCNMRRMLKLGIRV